MKRNVENLMTTPENNVIIEWRSTIVQNLTISGWMTSNEQKKLYLDLDFVIK